MKSLSGLDATFLYLETPETPMHVGSLNLYELPRGFKGSFHAAVREHVGKRMHLAPIFSRRLAFMPLDLGHPMWVEAEEVDLDFHIRKVPGRQMTVRACEAACAKLHGQLIDREHPLWEFYVFDSLKAPAHMDVEGKLVGFYSKIHHAALDGKGGMVLANAVLDLTPTPREVAPADPSRKKRTAGDLKIGEMIGAVFSNSLAQYAKLARSLPTAATSLGGTVMKNSVGGGAGGIASLRPKSPIALAPRTVFNVGISRERVFATASVPFAESKAMARAVGGSFNDIVLWICSTALRNYLSKHAALPKKPLVAAMPVSLREESNKELNNQASITVVDLGTHLANPLKRMQAIMASTGKVKDALANLKSVLPTDYPSLLSPWVMGGAAKALFKTYGKSGIAERLPAVANVAISNVPGPQVPLYLAGAHADLSSAVHRDPRPRTEHHDPDLRRQRGLRHHRRQACRAACARPCGCHRGGVRGGSGTVRCGGAARRARAGIGQEAARRGKEIRAPQSGREEGAVQEARGPTRRTQTPRRGMMRQRKDAMPSSRTAPRRPLHPDLAPPSLALLALEFRAPFEFGSVAPAWPVLQRAPRGDGHSVLVFPGLSASDATTIPLRWYLGTRGYKSSGWSQGFNFGPRAGVLDTARRDLREAHRESGRKVSLIGWSLGGVYARELAKEMPELVRSVITLGSPFAGPPKSTNAWRFYELTSGRSIESEHGHFDLPGAPPVPTTSIYSRTDGLVAWQGSIQQPDHAETENIEVVASHIGLGVNPSAWWAIADRLAQEEGHWRPFDRTGLYGLKGLIYPDPNRG